MNNRIEKEIATICDAIDKARKENHLEDALCLMDTCARIKYRLTDEYASLFLENQLDTIVKTFQQLCVDNHDTDTNDGTVLFYDGFGLDNRGLALQYLDALINLEYTIIYVIGHNVESLPPKIESLIKQAGKSEIIVINESSYLEKISRINRIFSTYRPHFAFFYSEPYDVSGIVSFTQNKSVKRFLINLTDHMFWLGTHATDYILEFRDYGASISHDYRKIEKERLVKLPYYPYYDIQEPFLGFPFEKSDSNIVIFSGGALYKTLGYDNSYYKIVQHCLSNHSNVIFWYAGKGDDTELIKLIRQFPGRVFHTEERPDLISLLKNIDIYLNTFPFMGALMMQYAAISGRAPITLASEVAGGDILINEEKLGIEFKTLSEILAVLDKMIENKAFRDEVNGRMEGSVISKYQFKETLNRIMHGDFSTYEIKYRHVNTEPMKITFRNALLRDGINKYVNYSGAKTLIKYKPWSGFRYLLYKFINR